jgi:hypothetical protein
VRNTWKMGAALAAVLAVTSTGVAAPFVEVGDAGDTPGTAQITVGVGPLDSITGSIDVVEFADVFRISITNPLTFSATTAGSLLDTQLYLFNLDGTGIAFNDDATGVTSTLPAGNPLLTALAPGDYLLVISTFDSDPINSAGLEIFPDTFTGVLAPIAGRGAFVDFVDDGLSDFGPYTITLTGAGFAGGATPPTAAVPEPASMTLLAAGAVGLVGRRLRRKVAA